MSDPNPLAAEGDPPIIIQGAGSVEITVPSTFNAETVSGYQEATGGNGKKFKNNNVHLISLQIDGNEPIPLNKNSTITITYK
ncbi:MAG TPA: hypothetical protein VGW12_18615 [Pyrinomonadaceae bacterium]|nr:hypothetical protein [Pyrinomonadaceae bacterium]